MIANYIDKDENYIESIHNSYLGNAHPKYLELVKNNRNYQVNNHAGFSKSKCC